MRLKADILLFIVAIIWGTGFVAQGVAARKNKPPILSGAYS